jgi:tripartite-type tricarboxylate transporter receptor subunit TctC
MIRRTLLGTLAATAALAALTPSLLAQEVYPSRSIRLVVPFPAGGATDVVARHYATAMSRELGQELVVENKAGAAGAIGAADVARGRADGYSILFGTASTQALHNLVAKTQQYDAIKDFTPVGLVGAAPLVFVASTKLTGDLKAILQQAKDKPGVFSYGSPGQGTFMHLAAERLKQAAGNPDIAHVGYRGSGPAMNDLVAGQIGLMVDTIATALPQHRAGTARILAITADARSSLAPDIPTVDEVMGTKGFAASLWNVVAVPAATPPAIVDRLNAATRKVVADADFIKRLSELGVEASRPTTPAEARTYIIDEQARWKPVVEQAGIVQN